MNVFTKIWTAGAALADAMTRLAVAFNGMAEQVEQRGLSVDETPAIEMNGKPTRPTRLAAK